LPMPGTPFYEPDNLKKAIDKAVADATALYEGGADGCLVQTIDRIYPVGEAVDFARLAAVTTVTNAVAEVTDKEFQIGVQILWNAHQASLAVASVCGGSFLRCNAFVGSTLTPSGVAEGNPVELINYRNKLNAQHIKLIAEIDGMHFHWLDGRRSTVEVAKLAITAGADAVEIAHKDEATNLQVIRDLKEAYPNLPVILGGHTNHENVARRLAEADGALVGSCFEPAGWGSHTDIDRVKAYMDIVATLN
ncbi:MAG: BtpA/SgcQ family protein, partial [Chloroflexota bacterium]